MRWFSGNERKTIMKKTHHTTEQIIRILREADAGVQSHEELCRQHKISPQTFYWWKSKYGGMGITEAQQLREMERENTELNKLLADQMLKNKALEIALAKNA
jgi:putative transposase